LGLVLWQVHGVRGHVTKQRGSRWNAAVATKPHPFVTYETRGARECDAAASTTQGSGPFGTANLPERNRIRTLAQRCELGTADRAVNRASAFPAGRLPRSNGVPRRLVWAEPEVVFRIVHVALDDGSAPPDGPVPPKYREQAVEIALGPNPTFPKGSLGALTRRVPSGQIVNAAPPSRRRARSPRLRKPVGPPRIVETLRNAIEWPRQLDAGEVPNQAAVARFEVLEVQVEGFVDLPAGGVEQSDQRSVAQVGWRVTATRLHEGTDLDVVEHFRRQAPPRTRTALDQGLQNIIQRWRDQSMG